MSVPNAEMSATPSLPSKHLDGCRYGSTRIKTNKKRLLHRSCSSLLLFHFGLQRLGDLSHGMLFCLDHLAIVGNETVDLVLYVADLGINRRAKAVFHLGDHVLFIKLQEPVIELTGGLAGAVAIGLIGVIDMPRHAMGKAAELAEDDGLGEALHAEPAAEINVQALHITLAATEPTGSGVDEAAAVQLF